MASAPTAPATTEESDRAGRWWWTVLAVLTALPILVLIVVLARRTWYPTGDLAQAELRMRSIPRHPTLLGAAGRIADDAGRQGNHPGPLMFWVTWPIYALLGRSSWAFEAATAIVSAAWLAVAVRLVRRRSGSDLVTAGFSAVVLVMIGAFGLDALTQPWNPWVALLPFLVLVLATWSALDGGRWAPVLAVAAGSYAIQGHVGYAPIVLPLVAIALLVAPVRVARARRQGRTVPPSPADPDEGTERADVEDRRPGPWWLVVVVAVLAALVLWSGPILDLFVDHPNNVSKLLANFASPDEAPIGPAEALRLLGRCLSPVGPWLTASAVDLHDSAVPGLLLLGCWAVVAIVVARRRIAPVLSRLDAVLTITLLAGWFALSRVFGVPYLYLFRWACVLTALLVFTLGWGLAVLVADRRPDPTRRSVRPGLLRAAAVGVAVLAVATSVRVARQPIPYGYSGSQVAVLAPEVAERLPKDRRYLVTWDDPTYLGGLGYGLLLDLERRGFDVGTGPETVTAAERHRVRCPGDYDAVIVVVTGPEAIAAWQARPGTRLVAQVASSDGSYDELATLRDLQRVLAAHGRDLDLAQVERSITGLVLDSASPPEAAALAKRLVTEGLSAAVFVQDPAPPAGPVEHTVATEACWKPR